MNPYILDPQVVSAVELRKFPIMRADVKDHRIRLVLLIPMHDGVGDCGLAGTSFPEDSTMANLAVRVEVQPAQSACSSLQFSQRGSVEMLIPWLAWMWRKQRCHLRLLHV